MVRKKIDNRIRVMIENGVALGHRTMFVVVGDKGRDQVVILHHMLSKASVKARPTVLWCYKKELGFTSHRKKRMKQLQKKVHSGKLDVNEEDPFELFVASTNIRYCYYSETHKILGNTFGMCILQDFEAMTPNLLARTIETVEGGGIVMILLRTMASLKQLYTMSMDVHSRYRTEAHQDVVGRFNERFILSLTTCKKCIVMDDQLHVLPLSSQTINVNPVQPKTKESLNEEELQLKELKESLQDTQPVGVLANNCRTLDQARALLKFVEAISEKSLRTTVALTAARGRGKSAALGLAIAGAVAFSYSNIFVTSPSPENLSTLFEFIFKGFDSLEYQEHLDYEVVQSTNPEFNKAVIRVNIFRDHRQTIQYIHPSDAAKLGQAELLIIDEAAAIPLPLVKSLLGPYLVFMASTINGYEGTGRSLSLKLIQQLRVQMHATSNSKEAATNVSNTPANKGEKPSATGRLLYEIQLTESIRYKQDDDVEMWLNNLLCLDATEFSFLPSGCPLPEDCDLYYVNRDTLFSFHRTSEVFLQRLMTLYVSSHYKNSPNDLQMMSDAPAHHLFCLLAPVSSECAALPEVLCVIQVCLEGEISKSSIMTSLSRGKRAAGDLIPWTVAQQFQDNDFPGLSGARIIRIATHPNYLRMGYGTRSLTLIQEYYAGKIHLVDDYLDRNLHEIDKVQESVELLEEKIVPKKSLPPLLLKLSERQPEKLDYLGVSFGLTADLLKFWKKVGFAPVYIRQTHNDLTGEHSCIMLKVLNSDDANQDTRWLGGFWHDFRRRFLSLLSFQFSTFHPSMALNIIMNNVPNGGKEPLVMTKDELEIYVTQYDLKRLELYASNMVDYHLITDLLPILARLYFLHQMIGLDLSALQACILLGLGLQHKTADNLAKELDLPTTQLLGIFNRIIRKISQYLTGIAERDIANKMAEVKNVILEPTEISLQEDLNEAALEFKKKQNKERAKLAREEFSQFAIKGSESEWQEAIHTSTGKTIISLKSEKKKDHSKKRSLFPRDETHSTTVPTKHKKRLKKR